MQHWCTKCIYAFVIVLPLTVHAEKSIWDELESVQYDQTVYGECLSEGLKNAKTDSAVAALRNACYIKSIPKACRNLATFSANICIDKCKKASLWSRSMGECSH